jgi:hypothetical protein
MNEQVIQPVITFVIIAIICLGVFLAIRVLMLWYWRINSILENQEKQLLALKAILQKLTPSDQINPPI